MSDSSLSGGDAPTDATLEQSLRNAVQKVYKMGNMDDLTVRRIRKAVEEDMDLQEDFFKNDPIWNTKSKSVIQFEVDAHPEPFSSQRAPSSPPIQKKLRPSPPLKSRDQTSKAHGTKRASTEKVGSKKRRKKNTSDDQESGSDIDQARSKKLPAKVRKPSLSSSVSPPPKEEDEIQKGLHGASKANGADGELSESEMSELIDEEPKSKGRGRKSGSAKPKTKKTVVSKSKRTSEQPTAPDAEEIKKLQGWLVKCGIRKIWGKELAPYDNPKAKIRHLREMLADAGMTGRFSTEKANQIKEERELRADLEAVQEGNKHWGKPESGDEDGGGGRPRRRLARGLEGLDFLNDDDGEETD